MKIKISDMISFLWGLVLTCKVIFYTNIPISSTPIYYISSVLLIFILIYYLLHFSFKSINNLYYLFLFIFLFFTFFFGVVLVNPAYINETLVNVRIMLVFYLLVFFMGNYIYQSGSILEIVRVTYSTLAILILIMFIMNFNNMIGIGELVQNMLSGFERSRMSFGFNHPNFLGNTSLCVVMLTSFFTKKNTSFKKLLLVRILNLLFIYIILATASRSSFVGLVFFEILRFVVFLPNIFSRVSNYFYKIVLMILAVVSLIYVINIGIVKILTTTNRVGNFIYNIPILITNHRLWCGLAYVGSGDFISKITGTFFVDNYILYTLMSSGIIGLLLNFIFIIVIWRKLLIARKTYVNKIISIILVVNLFISFTENCFMYPTFPSCFIYTILYLSILSENDKKSRFESSTFEKFKER